MCQPFRRRTSWAITCRCDLVSLKVRDTVMQQKTKRPI